MDTEPALHPSLGPLAGYLGVFEGDGEGGFPTSGSFRYRERVSFSQVGTPFLRYEQRTWHPERGTPMHAELGYLRLPARDRAELVVAQPTGLTEIEEGSLADGVLTLASTLIGHTSTAKPVRSLRRTFELDGDVLRYNLWMGYREVEEAHHLAATLHRVG